MFLATGFMLVGIFFMRYDLVLAGQIVPVFHAMHVEEYSSLLLYMPSLHEISVVVAGICLAVVLFLGGEKVLNGHKFQKHAIVPPGGFICPGCGGKFILKQSFYGKFYGCENYPKCRFMMKLDGTIREGKAPTKKKTTKKKTTKKPAKKKKEAAV